MESAKQDPKDAFREALRDATAVVEKLAPHWTGNAAIEELWQMLNLGLSNDGQLKLLMETCKPKR